MFQSVETPDGELIPTLRVPYLSQTESDHMCLIYSLLMVFNYYRNVFEKESVRRIIPEASRDDLVSLTGAEYGLGITISQKLIADLNGTYPELNFSLEKNSSMSKIQKSIEEYHPPIVIYNITQILNDEEGPGHAGVLIGLNKNLVVLNNPWLGWAHFLKRIDFERAWEIEYNQVIYSNPSSQMEVSNVGISS